MRKLCIRSLQRGVGSMDFIQGLLSREDDLDEGHEEDESDVTLTPSTSTDLACGSNAGTPDPAPSPSNNAIPWRKCGVCQIMPQEIENKCRGLRRCVTTHTRFSKLCLDPDVIQLAIRNRGDIRNDRDDNSTRAFRKTGYRQYILDRYGYWILFTVGNVDRDIGRYSGRHSVDSRSTLGRHSVDIAVDTRSRQGR